MTGRRKEKGKYVKDVYVAKEWTALEENSDAEAVGSQAGGELEAAARANFGEFVSGGKSGKSRHRKKHGGAKGKAAPGIPQDGQVLSAVDRQDKHDAGASDSHRDSETCDSPRDLKASASDSSAVACNGENKLENGEGNSGEVQNREGAVPGRTKGGEESVPQRLERFMKASVIPSLSPEESESNVQEQEDEIMALEAIYGEDFKRFNNDNIKTPSFAISVNVDIPENIILWAEHPSTSDSSSTGGNEHLSTIDGSPEASTSGSSENESMHIFTVQSLPPFRLVYTLPVSYPSHSPPLFTLSSMWLNSAKLSRLCSALDKLWAEQKGQVVVYSWIEWLQTQSLSFLGMSEKLELGPYAVGGEICRETELDGRALSGCISFESDIARLLRHNEERRNEEFCKAIHTCYICFSEHLGKDFARLPCQHIFCMDCMQTLATVHVKEGSVNKLNCPDTSCRGSIPPYLLKQLLEEEVFQRWEDLVLQRSLDAMMDIVYCPRCETVCIEEQDNFVQCTKCFYSFCSLCRQTWHVGQECMSVESRLRILQERRNGSKSGEDQRRKEEELRNEMMNLNYVRREAKQCPKCKMAISKTEGCNKMVCSNCGQYFCFKCGDAIAGYNHFADGKCRLFEEEEIQRWQPEALLLQQQAQVELELWPERGRPCPNCRQLNVKTGNNNHIYCWACRNSYCCLCNKIVRRTSEHYGSGPSKCRQHTAD
ncbi:hypothetical protein Mapa_000849 [Marchantia paleacea]|nr:hypothetical protein Mapa_000849 [Marchantia paleacea]